MKLAYKQKLFIYFFIIFAAFTVFIALFQQNREKVYKTEALRGNLNEYADLIDRCIESQQLISTGRIDSLNHLLTLLPRNLRLTVVDFEGKVLFDNSIEAGQPVENHLQRPEVQTALVQTTGSAIRLSATTGIEYYYFAKAYGDFFVRVALPYDIEVQNFLKSDNIFLYFVTLLFFIALVSLLYLSDHLGKAISGLKDFILSTDSRQIDYNNIHLPNNELGEIGEKIIQNYRELEESNHQINIEREKLLRHFHYSDEGIAIFSADGQKIYANTHFIQYLNTILDEPTFTLDGFLDKPEFRPAREYLVAHTPANPNATNLPVFKDKIEKGSKHFNIKLLIFPDNSYEVTLNDISNNEQNRLLKQEMTNNIAHELRTPVSSIRGYLETLLAQPAIDPEKQHLFLERAFKQIIRLSDLIRDISLITKTEEAASFFEKEEIPLHELFEEVVTDLHDAIEAQGITVLDQLDPAIHVEGNRTLLYAIFRNLIENSIHYAGDHVTLAVNNYMEDRDFYYFSYYDTGRGIEEKHLERIFERFYRVNEGRSRQNGGSGLGLSIVKNAVLFHHGEISVKNRKEGGLEFLFSLKKHLD